MKTSDQLAARQLFILTFGFTVGTSILVTPAGLVFLSREDAWLAAIIGLILNVLMSGLYILIARLYPGKTLPEISELALGKWLGKIVSMVFISYFLLLGALLVGDLGFFVTSEMMPNTPMLAIKMIFLLAVVIGARLGIVVLGRVSELMFPWIVLFLAVLFATLLPQFEWHYVSPFLEAGLTPVMKAGYNSSMFQELVVLMMFMPFVRDQKKAGKAVLGGTALGGLVIVLITLISILVLGVELAANSTFPAFALAKTINIGNFLQRIEGILIAIWVLTIFLKMSMCFLTVLMGIKTVFGCRSYLAFVYPLVVLTLVITLNTYTNTVYVLENIQKGWAGYSMFHMVILPLVIYLAGLLRQFRNRTVHASK